MVSIALTNLNLKVWEWLSFFTHSYNGMDLAELVDATVSKSLRIFIKNIGYMLFLTVRYKI